MSITIDDGSPRLETGGQGHRDRPAAARQLPASQQPARSLRQQPGALWEVSITDRLIRTTTALAVATAAAVAAVISYRHAYELARTHGETGAPIARPPGPVSRRVASSEVV